MQILVADSAPAACFALCTFLEQYPGWQVVGEVSTSDQLLEQVKVKCPDVLLLDWNLPEISAADMLPSLIQQYPQLYIIVLSGRPEVRLQAMAAGAHAFVSKANHSDRLLEALSAIPNLTE